MHPYIPPHTHTHAQVVASPEPLQEAALVDPMEYVDKPVSAMEFNVVQGN